MKTEAAISILRAFDAEGFTRLSNSYWEKRVKCGDFTLVYGILIDEDRHVQGNVQLHPADDIIDSGTMLVSGADFGRWQDFRSVNDVVAKLAKLALDRLGGVSRKLGEAAFTGTSA